mmetsp:Transcript_12282/g.45715  ORF Transcript_12282/g.45715 Transcript_12282/m.45715 type:complete len:654 (+) Transcript_12282:1509-3470(+)
MLLGYAFPVASKVVSAVVSASTISDDVCAQRKGVRSASRSVGNPSGAHQAGFPVRCASLKSPEPPPSKNAYAPLDQHRPTTRRETLDGAPAALPPVSPPLRRLVVATCSTARHSARGKSFLLLLLFSKGAAPCGEKVTDTSVSAFGCNTPPPGETMNGFRFVPPAVGATTEPGGNQALHFSGTFVGLRTEVVVVVCAPKTQSPQSIGLRLEKSLLESLFLSLLSSFSSSSFFSCFPSPSVPSPPSFPSLTETSVGFKQTPSPFKTTRIVPTGVVSTNTSWYRIGCAGRNSIGIAAVWFPPIPRNAPSAAKTPSWSKHDGFVTTVASVSFFTSKRRGPPAPTATIPKSITNAFSRRSRRRFFLKRTPPGGCTVSLELVSLEVLEVSSSVFSEVFSDVPPSVSLESLFRTVRPSVSPNVSSGRNSGSPNTDIAGTCVAVRTSRCCAKVRVSSGWFFFFLESRFVSPGCSSGCSSLVLSNAPAASRKKFVFFAKSARRKISGSASSRESFFSSFPFSFPSVESSSFPSPESSSFPSPEESSSFPSPEESSPQSASLSGGQNSTRTRFLSPGCRVATCGETVRPLFFAASGTTISNVFSHFPWFEMNTDPLDASRADVGGSVRTLPSTVRAGSLPHPSQGRVNSRPGPNSVFSWNEN